MYSRRQTQCLMAQHCSLAPLVTDRFTTLSWLWCSGSGSQVSSCATQKVWSLPLTIPWSISSCSYNLFWLCYCPYCFLLGYTEHWRWSWDNSTQYSVVQKCPWQLWDVTWHSYLTVQSCTKILLQKLFNCCTEEQLHG